MGAFRKRNNNIAISASFAQKLLVSWRFNRHVHCCTQNRDFLSMRTGKTENPSKNYERFFVGKFLGASTIFSSLQDQYQLGSLIGGWQAGMFQTAKTKIPQVFP